MVLPLLFVPPRNLVRGGSVETYTLTIVSANGTVAKDPDQETYHLGDIVELTATPAEGYDFTAWSGDITSEDNPVEVEITGDMEITAGYEVSQIITYQYHDQFTTPEVAPLTSPRDGDVGTFVIVDAQEILSISSGQLVASGTPLAETTIFRTNAAIPFVGGTILQVDIDEITAGRSALVLDDGPNSPYYNEEYTLNTVPPGIIDGRDNKNGIGNFINLVSALTGTYSIVMRENGGVFFVKDGALIWPSYSRTSPDMYGLLYFHTSAQDRKLDNLKVYTATPSGLNAEYGISTAIVAAPSNGETISADADGHYRILWTPQAGETLSVYFRRSTDNDCMRLDCAQAGGTIKLYEVVGGADNEINSGKTQTWSVGAQYAITVTTWGTVVQSRVNNTTKHNTTSSVQQTTGGCKVSSTATPNINNFESLPRDLTGFPFV